MSDSIANRAQQLLALAQNSPKALVMQMVSELEVWGREAHTLLGETSGGMMLQSLVQQALMTAQQLLEGIAIAEQAATEEGNKHMG